MSEFVDKLRRGLGLKRAQRPEVQRLREALEAGRRAKFAEEYDRALSLLGQATAAAYDVGDQAAQAVVALHQAEVLIRLERWDEAASLLNDLEASARKMNEQVQMAYILSARGTLQQEKGDWPAAREAYEQALKAARLSHSSGAEGRALGHLGDAYLNEGNASYAMHLLREALPKLNTSGDIELSSYFVGRLGQAMIQSGQEVEGQHLLGRALQLAEQIHFHLYERHWALVLGERAYSESRYHEAYAQYAHALRLFQPESPDSRYVTALCHMCQVCLSLRDYHQALSYAEQAVTRAEGISEGQAANAWGAMGSALRALGRSAEAIPFLTAASEVYSRSPAMMADHIEVETLRNLAAAMVDADDPAAEETYQRALARAEQLQMPLQLAQTRRDSGLMYARRGDKTRALQEWVAALAIYDDQKSHSQVARLYTDMATARRALGQGQRALKDYEQSLMVLNSVDEHDYETRGVVLANAATVFGEQGDIDSTDSFFSESIMMAEKSGDTTAESIRRGNYGLFLLMIGRPRRALAMLEQALQISRAHNLTLPAAVQMSNIGVVQDALGSFPEALEHHRQALEQVRALKHPHWQGYIAVNQANTLMSLREFEGVATLIETALDEARAAGDSEVMVQALIAQARLARLEGRPETAVAGLDEAIALARRHDYRRLLAEAFSARSEQQAAMQRPDEALAAWDEAYKLYNLLRMPQARLQPAWLPVKQGQS